MNGKKINELTEEQKVFAKALYERVLNRYNDSKKMTYGYTEQEANIAQGCEDTMEELLDRLRDILVEGKWSEEALF